MPMNAIVTPVEGIDETPSVAHPAPINYRPMVAAAAIELCDLTKTLSGPPVRGHEPLDGGEIRRRVEEKLALVGLADAGLKLPSEISGGMKKRVGLARAIIRSPAIILYDEPTAGLDPVMASTINDLILDM